MLFWLSMPYHVHAQTWTLESPSGKLAVEIRLADLGGPQPTEGSRLFYRVSLPNARADVLLESPLGITRDDQSFIDGLTFVSGGVREGTSTAYYVPIAGKRRPISSDARLIELTFRNREGAPLQLQMQAFDDGLAFRYLFPDKSDAPRTVTDEITGFRLPEGSVMWAQPYDDPSQYTPAYEAYFTNGIPAGTPSPKAGGWGFPALFKTGAGAWVLLTEAGLDERYAGTRLGQEAPDRLYRIRFPDPGEGHGHGAITPSHTLPSATPWRVIIASDALSDIVASTLVGQVSPAPSAAIDWSWVRPGRVAWDWWSSPHPGPVNEVRRRFVDLAADMSWEYYLIDANWTDDDPELIRDIVAYAHARDVGILLWYNSAGVHNVVTERPRDRLYERGNRRREFQFLKELGIAGVKVDFFQSDKQASIALHLDILRDAADHELMVNFHGTTIPRGWERTYPNLLTMEAVRGAEAYRFDATYPENAPVQNTILPFTRNVIGSMDYTPVALSDSRYPRRTTDAHELALAVVFESGWVHFADRPEAYLSLAEGPKTFLRDVPAAWDEVRLLAGEPGRYVVLARRSGRRWYVGGLNGDDAPRTVTVDFSFLPTGGHTVEAIADGAGDREIRSERAEATRETTRQVTMRARGGFVMTIAPAGRAR